MEGLWPARHTPRIAQINRQGCLTEEFLDVDRCACLTEDLSPGELHWLSPSLHPACPHACGVMVAMLVKARATSLTILLKGEEWQA